MRNNQKGITLVALVITIIVLLILAGVTIAALSGDNGILKRGSEAKVQTNVQNAKDLINLGVQECMTNYYNGKYVTNDTEVNTAASIGAYIVANIEDTQAGSVIASVTSSGTLKITTNVTDANGGTMAATVDTDGSLTWENDKLIPTAGE